MPVASQPLKASAPASAPARHRLEMVRSAIGDDPRFEVSAAEIERGGLSYTVDTLEALSVEQPGATLFLILGVHAFGTLDRWKEPGRVKELATLGVLPR